MARVNYVKSARKAIKDYDGKTIIKVGQPYYWWKFRFGGKQVSVTPPKRSQLTQSGFLSQLYDIQDTISGLQIDSPDELSSERDNIVSELQNLADECQSSLDNMPEHLQESSSSGELLRERIEALENAVSEFESIDLDYDEPDDDDVKAQLDADASEDDIAAEKDAMAREWIDEKIGEMSDVDIDCG